MQVQTVLSPVTTAATGTREIRLLEPLTHADRYGEDSTPQKETQH